ncbi:tRNA-histidine guanylyltransferase isoform X2 [Tachypleus tridentatus]|uniref:tRNA-histidine guanylyltransferase isoform X2 n=1 Tax=Tachypleus tridentatus TaxID=6853 RepID=UPI003FD61CF2
MVGNPLPKEKTALKKLKLAAVIGVKKIYTRNFHRVVKETWFSQFPWLEHVSQQNTFHCKLCRDNKKTNIYATTRKNATKHKKDNLVKHAWSEGHHSVVASKVLKKDMSTAALNVYMGCKCGIQAQMATSLVQAKEAIPTVKFYSLLSLQVFSGVTSQKKLQTQSQSGTESFIYTHNQSLDGMYSALNHVVQDEMQADFWTLPFPLFALEATDARNTSIVIIYIRYLSSLGEVTSRFLAVHELTNTGADSICNTICSVMADRCLMLIWLDLQLMVQMSWWE